MYIETHNVRRVAAIAVMAVVLTLTFITSSASASVIVTFMPEPASPDDPEFIWWDGEKLSVGPGAYGTGFGHPAYPGHPLLPDPGSGDGDWDPALQNVPGLQIVTPFAINDLPGGVVNEPDASTDFYDVTLDIHAPLYADGPAQIIAGFYVIQQLGGSTFTLWSTDPEETGADVHNPVPLLTGIINSAKIVGILNSGPGVALSADIDYTGGAIYDAARAQFNSYDLKGSLAWSLIDAPLTFENGVLGDFEANGTGQFSGVGVTIISEPATFLLLASGFCMQAMRRRRRMT